MTNGCAEGRGVPVQTVGVAAIQMQMGQSRQGNVERALEWVEQAAQAEAKIVLLPELFEGVYFPQTEEEHYFDWAHPFDLESHPFLSRFQDAAKQLGVVLPVSFFEKAGPSYYNSLCVFDADGANLGLYRKAHIPDGPSYEEKFYFSPGNTPPRVFKTRFGSVGIGICWDQWFPELARLLTLQGADILLYPTAIGSEPPAAGELETRKMWRRAMVGHAVCNAIPVVAANRMGAEGAMHFYGNSFIADHSGEILCSNDRAEEGVVMAQLDFALASRFRAGMGFFRDRRPDLYAPLLQREVGFQP
jgi:N-carbamoylputrescine amidase